ncbi:MAG: hypothetical protein ACOX5Z_05980 [Desulfobulbus sp.]
MNFFVLSQKSNGKTVFDAISESVEEKFIKKQHIHDAKKIDTNSLFTLYCNSGHGRNCDFFHDPVSGSCILVFGTWIYGNTSGDGDGKYLLRQFSSHGVERFAKNLDGFFVVVVWDDQLKEMHVITDRIGSCFCFLRKINDEIVLSNSSYFLATIAETSPDYSSAQEFFHLGIIYGNKTFFKEIERLDRASITTVKDGKISSRRYWDISRLEMNSVGMDEAVDLYRKCLYDSVECVCSSEKKYIADLTAGLDSRVLVTGLLHNKINFSTNVVGKQDGKDVVISGELARLYNIEHEWLCVDEHVGEDNLERLLFLTDGELDLFEYSKIHQVHVQLSSRFAMGLNGSFGELARGYWWELLVPHVGRREKIDSMHLCRKRFGAQYGPMELSGYSREEMLARLALEVDSIVEPLAGSQNTFQMDCNYLFMRMRCWQGRIASATNRIWPCFSPLMLAPMLELLLCLPPEVKRSDRLYKHFLVRENPRWARHRTEYGYPPQPLTLANFPQFWPIPVLLGKKIGKKIVGRLGLRHEVPSPDEFILRDNFYRQTKFFNGEEIDGLVSSDFFDRDQLKQFIKASLSPEFSYQIFWRRLVSYEIAMQSLPSLSHYN